MRKAFVQVGENVIVVEGDAMPGVMGCRGSSHQDGVRQDFLEASRRRQNATEV
jgi:hypothetical protein